MDLVCTMVRKRGKAILCRHTCHNRTGRRPDNAISVMRTRMTNVTSNARHFIVHDHIQVTTITAIILIRVSRVDSVLGSFLRRGSIQLRFHRVKQLYRRHYAFRIFRKHSLQTTGKNIDRILENIAL